MAHFERTSLDGSNVADLTSVIAEFPEGDEMPGEMIPVKKLSEAFDNCARGDGGMKVFLRIRPMSASSSSIFSASESTIIVESGNEIDD